METRRSRVSKKMLINITKKIGGPNYKITKNGLILIEFIENEELFPNSPDDVKKFNKDYKNVWKLMLENNVVNIHPSTEMLEETYSLNWLYEINVLFEIVGKPKYFYEPRVLKKEGKENILELLEHLELILH